MEKNCSACRLLIFFWALLFIFAVTAQNAHAKMYIWADENGVKHFSDTPPSSPRQEPEVGSDVPKDSSESKTIIRIPEPENSVSRESQIQTDEPVTKEDPEQVSSKESNEDLREFLQEGNQERGLLSLEKLKSIFKTKNKPANTKDQTKSVNEVQLYFIASDPASKEAIAFFDKKGISYVAYDIEKDKKAALRKRQMDPSGMVPLAIINDKIFVGFEEGSYQGALK
ncbi:MAG: DUF4124 domain-containing protein [Desulfobacteraceae bacterium]|nr:DUF4124 domain-containing protein [Desulfobacteraceae bacterium]